MMRDVTLMSELASLMLPLILSEEVMSVMG